MNALKEINLFSHDIVSKDFSFFESATEYLKNVNPINESKIVELIESNISENEDRLIFGKALSKALSVEHYVKLS
jgi:hypothetical protein